MSRRAAKRRTRAPSLGIPHRNHRAGHRLVQRRALPDRVRERPALAVLAELPETVEAQRMTITLSDAPWPCILCRRPLPGDGGMTGVPRAIYPEKHEPL